MNGTGNKEDISADPVPQRTAASWVVRDKDDNFWGPFESLAGARLFAIANWPDVPEFDEGNFDGDDVWEVVPVKHPGT